MKRIVSCVVCLSTALFCFSGCASDKAEITPQAESIEPLPASTAEESCLRFIESELSDSGGVYTNNIGKGSGELASGKEILSESEGLLLCYYAACSDREQYDSVLSFVRNKLDSGEIISYRLSEDGSRYHANAAVDDLRILRGLAEGSETFSEPEYASLCAEYADRLYLTNVKDGLLLDFYDEESGDVGSACTLCYSDLKTMRLLGGSDARWLEVEEKMQGVVLGGYLGDAFPLFQTRYLPEKRKYSSEKINMIEALLTALHLSEAGKCPSKTVRWLKNTLSAGPVYGAYKTDGTPATNIESTAVYALCTLLGVSENDSELAAAANKKLSSFQITDRESSLFGAFADEASGEAYSFDNLMALTSMNSYAEYLQKND